MRAEIKRFQLPRNLFAHVWKVPTFSAIEQHTLGQNKEQ